MRPIEGSNRFLPIVGRPQACRGLETDASAAALRSNFSRGAVFNDTNKNIRLRGDSYVYAGGSIPGELIHPTKRAVMSACRAFFKRSYLSLPRGCSHAGRQRTASEASQSLSPIAALSRNRIAGPRLRLLNYRFGRPGYRDP